MITANLEPKHEYTASRRSGGHALLVVEATSGGVGRHVLDLSEGLVERGWEVTLVYSRRRMEPWFAERMRRIDSVRAVELSMRRSVHPGDSIALARLIRFARKHGPFDVVHGHSSKAGALARLLGTCLRLPVVYTPHALVTLDPQLARSKRVVYSRIERLLGRQTAALIAVSEDEARHARDLGIDPAKVRVVVNGIAPPRSESQLAVRNRLEIDAEVPVVGFIGRLVPQKAPEILVDAFAAVVQQIPNAVLAMVGGGPLQPALEAQAAGLGIATNVRWLGEISGQRAIPAFDVFCLSSRYEGLPYVLLEALAGGVPVVATRVGGTDTVIEHDLNGLIVSPEDSPALSAALIRLLSDAALREQMSDAARARACVFDGRRMVDRTIDVYRSVCNRSASSRRKRAPRSASISSSTNSSSAFSPETVGTAATQLRS